jgi:mannose-1-phosphate guanylyltransferase
MSAAAIVLAGGDGTRLRSLTRRLAGDDRPKQFCALLGDETLLDQTRRRAARLVAPEHTVLSVTQTHESYYRSALADVSRANIVAQPCNRGTAPAILYALMRLRRLTAADAVVLLPSDHYVSDDDGLMARVEGAMEAVRRRPELFVLLGIEPDRPEVEYGWIEPAEVILGRWAWPIYRVRRFWEKPPRADAQRLLEQGCLWNTFVIVANPCVLEECICGALPSLAAEFEPVRARVGAPGEDDAASDRTGVERPGEPARVLATQRRLAGALATA